MIELIITPLQIWDSIYGALSTMMQPLYWAISGALTFWHWVFTPLFGYDSGVTWTLSIVFLTIMMRTLMIPLFIKQINSARNMQLLQPRQQALQKKYGADRQKLGEETMKMYREEGVNPMASCMPLLLQMPVFLSLFRVLQGVADGIPRGRFFRDPNSYQLNDLALSLRNAEFLGVRLSDRVVPFGEENAAARFFTEFGATQVMGIVLVILLVVSLFITQLQLMRKNMPPEALQGPMAQQQKMMLYLFPVIYAVTTIFIPIGVLMYWLTTNLWTMGQQGLLIRNNPAPNTPAYLDWEDRMRAKGKDPDQIMAERAAKRRRKKGSASTASAAKPTMETTGGEAGEATEESKPRVVRQQVQRQTTRDGQTVRRQPRSTSRSTRKNK